jgi:Predicted bile acid beta-glucosidase
MNTINKYPTYTNKASEVAFLIGGIGTGTYSVTAGGTLTDFEWWNRPGKGNKIPYSFFSLWYNQKGGKSGAKILEARLNAPHGKPLGYSVGEAAGLPRFKESTFSAKYPFATIELKDETVPLKVEMETFNPFIPLDADSSGIPGGIIRYTLTNTSNLPVETAVCGSMTNVAGLKNFERETWDNLNFSDYGVSEYIDKKGLRGLSYYCENLPETHLHKGSVCLLTDEPNVSHKTEWLRRGNWDGLRDFWDDFSDDGALEKESVYVAENPGYVREMKTGSLSAKKTLQPGEIHTFRFYLCWSFPNRPDNWEYDRCDCGHCEDHSVKNYYANAFPTALAAAQYLSANLQSLEERSRKFTDALYNSTLPVEVIESAANNITTLRSTVCMRLENGTFIAWEGAFAGEGCCEGSCTHVWNYAQTVAFLFPELEKTMRKVEFELETDEEGRMAFRTRQVFGQPKWDYHPAADGQMGCVIRLYRDWKMTGDDEFLRSLWQYAKKSIAYALNYWDKNGDNVLDAEQHNTYDIEFYGENSLTNSMFYTALICAVEIETYLGNPKEAAHYAEILKSGSAEMDKMLWNGEYYIQNTENPNKYLYQYGKGCLSDQVLGELFCHMNNLPHSLPREHVKSAIHAVYKYNFIQNLEEYHSTQRAYALNDEAGLVLCTWPNGGRPKLPFIYSDEVWAGVEYQVAAHLVYEGFTEEGLEIVKAVRDRHNGHNRNPYCEVESGNHYVRSMSSWMLLTALSDFKFDMTKNRISFEPKINKENFRCFFSTGKAWGILEQKRDETGKMIKTLNIVEGENIDLEENLCYQN